MLKNKEFKVKKIEEEIYFNKTTIFYDYKHLIGFSYQIIILSIV